MLVLTLSSLQRYFAVDKTCAYTACDGLTQEYMCQAEGTKVALLGVSTARKLSRLEVAGV